MDKASDRGSVHCFGQFELDMRTGELRRNGTKVRMQEQPFQILALLLERAGEVVTREELQRKLWTADTFVDFDNGLNIAVKKLRVALGDDAEAPRYIETLPRRGYRFMASVECQPVTEKVSAKALQPTADVAAAPKSASPQTLPEAKSRKSTAIAAIALLVIASILLLMGNVAGVRDRLLGRSAGRTINSIAVLPWQNLSADPTQEYFA